MSTRGFFVTGTDTGVGKTVVAAALVRSLRVAGIDVAAMKAVETGVGDDGPLDAIALRRAAGDEDPLDEVCPQRFGLPAAPDVAAAREGRAVDLDAIRTAFWKLAARHAAVVLEGAGGLLVPLHGDYSMADLARDLRLPLVVVVRGRLGTINHTLLTLAAARDRSLDVAGVVVSHADGPLSDADEANLDSLRVRLGPLLIGEVRPLAPGDAPAAECFDLAPLVARLS